MIKRLALIALSILMTALACALPTATVEVTPVPSLRAVSQLIVHAAPGSTPTATPFQPSGPTSTSYPTETPVSTDTPEPDPVIAQPTEIHISQQQAEGTVNILVMGSDYRPSSGFRTDVLMLVSIHGDDGTVSVVSFPRDLYVTIPGWMEQRINTAFPHGGFSLLADTLEYNFGVRPDYYVLTTFEGFIEIIDTLGGVPVNIERSLTDKCDLPQAVNTYCTVNPGVMIMNGKMALWYVRSRHSTSDLDRLRRAQEVLQGLFNRLMSLDAVSHLPELYSSYQQSVQTNMSIDDMASLLSVASLVASDPSRIHRYTVGAGLVYNYVTAEGAQVLLPNYDAIRQMLKEAVY
jgi:LCP family protein required for cell wall assembly